MSQRVLITAGANGIGLATAGAFAADGTRVHIADINAEAVAAVTAGNPNITGSVTDVSDPGGPVRRRSISRKRLTGRS